MKAQEKQPAWAYQWSTFEDESETLFREWIHPNRLEDFRDKSVLDAGCGGGHHLRLVAPHAREVWGVDLNCADIARAKCAALPNVTVHEADIARMDLGRQFDVVYSIGVLHHTDDARASFRNLVRHVRPGGRIIVWVYSYEGNRAVRWIVEPLKRIYGRWPRRALSAMAYAITAILYVPVHSVYRLPLPNLPYYDYFSNFRRLAFGRNALNVFDKLNAPQTVFLRRSEIEDWFADGFAEVHISSYVGVSWRASGTRR